MTRRQRLDAELVRRQLVESRTEAVARIERGEVLVNGAVADKPSRQVHPGDAVVVTGPPPRYVSRGGEKLHAALARFGIDPSRTTALDAGASTGGFTDCLLQHGCSQVIAVDVGHGQLHPKLRDDDRVAVHERTHINRMSPDVIPAPVDIVVADLSFISLRSVLPALIGAGRDEATMVLLVKPQFEAGRAEVSRGRGVISDERIHDRVRAEVDEALRTHGCTDLEWIESPLTGTDGNREFLVKATTPRQDARRDIDPGCCPP